MQFAHAHTPRRASVIPPRAVARHLPNGLARRLANRLAAGGRRQHVAARVCAGALDDYELRVGKGWPRFPFEHVIAAQQRHARAILVCQRAIQSRFASIRAIHEHACERKAIDRVREHAAALRHGVIADHENERWRILQPRHHAKRTRLAEYHACPCIEFVEQQIVEAAMRIVDPHVARPARERTFHGRIRFERHPAARLFVFGIAGARLLYVENATNAFDID